MSTMANMRHFDGKEDAAIWLTDFDVFCTQLAPNVTDDQKLQMAQVRFSPEVDACRQSVAAKMQLVFRAEWLQTWPRVRAMLIAISGEYVTKRLESVRLTIAPCRTNTAGEDAEKSGENAGGEEKPCNYRWWTARRHCHANRFPRDDGDHQYRSRGRSRRRRCQ